MDQDKSGPDATTKAVNPFRFNARIEWRGYADAVLVMAVSPDGAWVRAADHDIIVADLKTLLARVLVMDLGSAEEAAEALGGLPEVVRLVEAYRAAHPRTGGGANIPGPDEVEF